MMSLPRAVVAACIVLAWSKVAIAQEVVTAHAYPVDDRGTVVMDPVLPLQWHPGDARDNPALLSASTRVSAQLNLTAWIGRNGRIYMTLPRNAGPVVRATWSSGGTLLPGSMLSGERALVYSGIIVGPLLRDTLDIRLEADAARLVRPEQLAFGFEIEVD